MKNTSKRWLAWLLTAVMLLTMIPTVAVTASAASSGSCGTGVTYTLDDAGLLTISGAGTVSGTIFQHNTDIKRIVIKSGVTGIDNRVFLGCSNLETVDIPASVETIGLRAFDLEGGSKLKAVNLAGNANLTIAGAAFENKASNYTVTYLNTLQPQFVGTNAFGNNATVYLRTDYDGTSFSGATVKKLEKADALTYVKFSNMYVVYYDSLTAASAAVEASAENVEVQAVAGKVILAANDGTGKTSVVTVSGSTYDLPAPADCGFTAPAGTQFRGWADGSVDGNVRQVGFELAYLNSNGRILYALWSAPVLAVTMGGSTTNYMSFVDAFAAVNGKIATITLLQDNYNLYDESERPYLTSSASKITLDLNGKTLTYVDKVSGVWTSRNPAFAGTVLIKNGTITAENRNMAVSNYSSYACTMTIAGDVTITTTNQDARAVGVGKNMTLIVEDGATLTSNNRDSGFPGTICVYEGGKVILNGGTVINNGSTPAIASYKSQSTDTTVVINGGTVAKMKVSDAYFNVAHTAAVTGNAWYKLTNGIPAATASVALGENTTTYDGTTYGKADSTVKLTVTPASGMTVSKVLANSTEAAFAEGAYSFTMPKAPVTLTAEASVATVYTVTWKIGATTVAETQVKAGETITPPASLNVPVPANYYGWKWAEAQKAGNGDWVSTIPDVMPAEPITVAGIWTVKLTLIDPDGNDVYLIGKGLTPEICAVGDTIYANYYAEYNKTGHTFWLVNENNPTERYQLTYYAGMPQWPTIPMDQNKTFRGTFIPNEYTVTVSSALGGAVTANGKTGSFSAACGSEVTLAATPATGYGFVDYTVTDSLDQPITVTGGKFTMPADDVTVTAVFAPSSATAYKILTYTMGLDGQYGAPTVENKTGTTNALITITPTAPEGFAVDAAASVLSGTVAADGGLELKVYLSRRQYVFKTVVDGVETPVTYYYGASVAKPADPAKTGFTFTGWNPAIPATMPANDVTVTAVFAQSSATAYKILTYTMGLDGQYGAPTVENKTGTTNALITITPTAPEGFAVDAASVLSGTVAADGGLELKVYLSRRQYVFKTVVDGVETPVTYYYGAPVAKPADPAKTGFTFTGWKPAIPATMPANDVTVTAVFAQSSATAYKILTYTMGLDGRYGAPTIETKYGVTNAQIGITVVVPEGFAVDAAASVLSGTVAADGGLELKVYFIRQQYVFKTVVDGVETTSTYFYGASIIPPAAPTKVGFTFVGWEPALPATMPAGNLTLAPMWKMNSASETDNAAWLSVLARLYQTKYAILAVGDEGGSVSDEGVTEVAYGRNKTYTITPDAGYRIADVLVNGESVGAVSEYTFKKVRRKQIIEVIFAPIETQG